MDINLNTEKIQSNDHPTISCPDQDRVYHQISRIIGQLNKDVYKIKKEENSSVWKEHVDGLKWLGAAEKGLNKYIKNPKANKNCLMDAAHVTLNYFENRTGDQHGPVYKFILDSLLLAYENGALPKPEVAIIKHFSPNEAERYNELVEASLLQERIRYSHACQCFQEPKEIQSKYSSLWHEAIDVQVRYTNNPSDTNEIKLLDQFKSLLQDVNPKGEYAAITLKSAFIGEHVIPFEKFQKLINTYQPKSTPLMEKKDEKQITATGRIGTINFQDLKDKSVLNITIATGKDKDNPEWQKVTLWNDLAKEHKGLAVGSKITVSGIEKDNPREKDGVKYNNKYIDAKTLDTYQKISVEGVVGKIEPKTVNGNELKEILLIHNYKENGEDKAKLYNVSLWNDKMSMADALKVGDKLKVEGEARHTKYGEGQMRVTFNNPKTMDITPKLETTKTTEVKPEPAAVKEVEKEAKAPVKKSTKNKGMEM